MSFQTGFVRAGLMKNFRAVVSQSMRQPNVPSADDANENITSQSLIEHAWRFHRILLRGTSLGEHAVARI